MWLVITLLMTCSLHEVAESSKQKYLPWMKNVIEPLKESNQDDVECLAKGSNGNEYRGTKSVSANGYTCLYWDRIYNIGKKEVSKGLGSHNHCRNPNNRSKPWCWVRGRTRKIAQTCHIPQCEESDTERTCGERILEQNFKIIGGSRASIESQPWLASIFKNDVYMCGGTLISPCWVLSAAHCFVEGRKSQLTVYLGKDNTMETNPEKEQKFKVDKIVLHQSFNEDNYNNDIALLKIVNSNGKCAVRTPSVRTACLPPAHHMIPYGSFCHIAGYGRERNDEIPGTFKYSKYMKEAQVQILSPSICERQDYYGNRVTENQFCAASPNWTEDACQGDSGGPLLYETNGRMFLFGIISWGEGCATQFKPGVYTKVNNYNAWIEKHTNLPNFTKGIMYPQKD